MGYDRYFPSVSLLVLNWIVPLEYDVNQLLGAVVAHSNDRNRITTFIEKLAHSF